MGRCLAVVLFAAVFTIDRAGARAADGRTDTLKPVALPAPVACTFRAKEMSAEIRLELAPGVPYLELDRFDEIEMSIPVAAAPARVGVKLKKGRISLEGLVPPAMTWLQSQRPLLLGQVFVPSTWFVFHWADAAAGEIEIEATLTPATLKEVTGVDRRLRARLRCDELGLEAGKFEELDAVGGKGLNEDARLRPGAPVPVSVTPGGPPVARLIPRRAVSEATTVMERRPGWTRINAILADDLYLVGWVPAASVRPPPKVPEIASIFGRDPPRVGEGELQRPFACDHDIPLAAEAKAQRRLVGTLGAGVRMEETGPAAAGMVIVRIDGLPPAKGARFLVRRADIEGCKAITPQS